MKIPVESALCLSARRFCHLGWKAVLPASSGLCHLTHVCHPKHWLKAPVVTVVGKAEDKPSLQVSEKSHEGETGYGCVANDTFGKHSGEQQLIKTVQRSFAVVRQGKQPRSCHWHRLVWHGTSTLLCLSRSLPRLSFFWSLAVVFEHIRHLELLYTHFLTCFLESFFHHSKAWSLCSCQQRPPA